MISTSTVLNVTLADCVWDNPDISSSMVAVKKPTTLSGYFPDADSSFFKPAYKITGRTLADLAIPTISDSVVSGIKKSVNFVPYNDSDNFYPARLLDAVLYEFILTTTVGGGSNTVRQYWGS
jgi:hypothetical protein